MRITQATQVLLAMLLGVATGVFFGEMVAFLKIAGDAFIMLLQMTVLPYIVVALITGLGRLTYPEAKRLALSGGSVLLVLYGIALAMVFLSPLAYPDWPSASFFSASLVAEPVSIDFLKLYIPANPFYSLANAVVPAIVVFSALVGLALIGVDNKRVLLEPLSAVGDALMRVTGFVAAIAPIGVFAIIASAAGTLSIEDLSRLQVYLTIDIVLAVILSFWILPGLITALTPIRYGEMMRSLRGTLLTAFATGSILIVLPLLARHSRELLSRVEDQKNLPAEEKQSLADILIPTFFTFPNLGMVMSLAFAPFAAWYIGSNLSLSEYPTLGVVGFASLFGGPVLAIPFLLDLFKMPADLFHLYVTVDVLSSRFGTLLAAMHLTTIALIGACAMEGAVRVRWLMLLRFGGITVVLVAGALLGLSALYTYVVVAPYTKDKALAGLQFLRVEQKAKVYKEPPPLRRVNPEGRPRTFDAISQSGVLRVCYRPDAYPMSYFNSNGDLVGFDIEMAHLLARQLTLKLELLPLKQATKMIETINQGYCDIAMVQLPVIPSVAVQVDLTDPVGTATAAILVHDYRREEFATWAKVHAMGNIRMGAYGFDFMRTLARKELPKAELIPFESGSELRTLLESGLPGVDIVLDRAEEASAWSILYPNYSPVIPRPVKGYPAAYALPRGSPILLKVVDSWLKLVQQDGTASELYDYWVQGKIRGFKEPRWSVIRNVLKWVD